MKPKNTFAQNIQQLITINYQRMVVFEQASFISDKDNLRSFYAERSGECEAHLKELYAVLNISEQEGENYKSHRSNTGNSCLKNLPVKKNATGIVRSIAALDKTVLVWYRNAIADIKSFPADLMGTINRQYQQLGICQSTLRQL